MAADPDTAPDDAGLLDAVTKGLLLIVQIGLADGAPDMRQVAAWALADVAKLHGLVPVTQAAPSRLH